MKPFAILVLIFCLVWRTDSERCDVCLSWKIEDHFLILTCKVDKLNDFIVFYASSSPDEIGLCVPVYPDNACIDFYEFGELHQDDRTNEAIFNIDIYKSRQVDGTWTCQKGGKYNSNTVEVVSSNTKFIRKGSECISYSMLWSLVGFAGIVILDNIIFLVLKEWKIDLQFCGCGFPSRWNCALKIVTNVGCCLLVSVIPAVVGHKERNTCPVPGAFTVLGAVVGSIRFIIYLHLEDNSDSSNTSDKDSSEHGSLLVKMRRKCNNFNGKASKVIDNS